MVWNYRCKTCARGTSLRSDRRHGGVVVGVGRAVLLMIFAAVAPGVTAARYPQDALRCLASLKEPDGLLICPEHRNAYCVKEVSTLAEEDCGRTTYYGDKWNAQTNKCEYRKCEASCEESSWDFEFEGEPYERNRFCCDFNFCNGAVRSLPRPSTRVLMSGLFSLLLAQAYMREQQAG